MIRYVTLRILFLGLCLCPPATLLRADAIAETIQNVSLSFKPSAGVLDFTGVLEFVGPNDGMVFGQARNSFGGLDRQSIDAGSGTGTVNVFTPTIVVNLNSIGGVIATATADGSNLTADNEAVAELFAVAGTASATARSTVAGTFEVTGTTTPFILNVSAALQIVENFAETDAFGVAASTEALFSLKLSNGATPVSFDNLVTVGRNGQQAFQENTVLTGSSSLLPDTPYSFTAVEESYANVVNAAVPESSPLILLITVLALSGLAAGCRRRSGMPAIRATR